MPQHPKLRQVIPDMYTPDHDNEQRIEEHHAIFGHYPPEDPREKCDHPMHSQIRRVMNGALIEVPFDAEAIVSDDSVVGKERDDRYRAVFEATRQFQREVEEEDKLKRMQEVGLIPAKLVY
jgi:hypothetical protein